MFGVDIVWLFCLLAVLSPRLFLQLPSRFPQFAVQFEYNINQFSRVLGFQVCNTVVVAVRSTVVVAVAAVVVVIILLKEASPRAG